jgi:thiamine biosynthesis lipoprotein
LIIRDGLEYSVVALLLTVTAACARSSGSAANARLVEQARVSMGSELRVSIWTPDEAAATRAASAVFTEFDRLESLMSVWRQGSDIQRLNAAAGGSAVAVSPDVIAVLQDARQISEWTGGRFDVTFGALSDLWRFDHDQDNSIPDMNEVRRRLPLIDYRALEIDERAGTARLARAGMRAHLGGIGKGFAIDKGVAILRRAGFRDFMIQSGGDLYAAGLKDGKPWRVGVQDPRGPAGRTFATVDLSDSTFSTSGDYERSFMKDGRRYHHIIDPKSGLPAQGCRSVTILAPNATLADGLSTGVFLLGPAEGMALVNRVAGVDALIVSSANEVLATPRLKSRLVLTAAPTDAP